MTGKNRGLKRVSRRNQPRDPNSIYERRKASGYRPPVVPVHVTGSTSGLEENSPYDEPFNVLPQEADLLEYEANVSIAHAAAPSTMRIFEIFDISGNCNIGDEEVRIFDKLKFHFFLAGSADSYTQVLHLFCVKGPSTMTFTAGDYNPNSGVKAAIEAALSGGSEIQNLPDQVFRPFRDGAGTVRVEGKFTVNLKDKINKFTEESEIAISQGRTKGFYKLIGMLRGKASTSSTLYRTSFISYHTRSRKLMT